MNWEYLSKQKLIVYGADWCGDCHRFLKILKKKDIQFKYIDIDFDQRAKDHMLAKAGEFSIPQLEVNDGPMVRAWHSEFPSHWDEETFFSELGAKLTA